MTPIAIHRTGCVAGRGVAHAAQYRRDGIVHRLVRDVDPVPVNLIWRRHDPHPATHAAVALLADLYRELDSRRHVSAS
jgi:hypothetical protein